MEDGYVAILIHLLDRFHRGVETDLVVEPQHRFFGDVYDWAIVEVVGVGVWNYGVEVVISTAELKNNYYGVFFLGSDVRAPVVLEKILSVDRFFRRTGIP